MDVLQHLFQSAWRGLRRKALLSAVIVMTLALGIGATTSVYSVVYSVYLKPLPYPDPFNIYWLFGPEVNEENLASWNETAHLFSETARFNITRNMTLGGTPEPEYARGLYITSTYLPLLDVRPILGRNFRPEEDRPGADAVAIISHSLWRRQFGSDPDVVGRPLTLNREVYTVIGVLPDWYRHEWYAGTEIWLPAGREPRAESMAFVRLTPGVTLDQARKALEAFTSDYVPDRRRGNQAFTLNQYHDAIGDFTDRRYLWTLLGVVFGVLLVTCANVASMLLARGFERQHEVALRKALGGSGWRLLLEQFCETLLLFLTGGAAGVLIAFPLTEALVAWGESLIPRGRPVTVDGQVMLFSLLLAGATALLFGLYPAWVGTKTDLNDVLKSAGARTGGRRRRATSILVVAETAIAVVLVLGTGLYFREFMALSAPDPGLDMRNKLTFGLRLPAGDYPDANQQALFYEELLRRLEALPGVDSASLANILRFSGLMASADFKPRPPATADSEDPVSGVAFRVSTNHIRQMGMQLVLGRNFEEQDNLASPTPVVVNQEFARRLWPDRHPIGQEVRIESVRLNWDAVVVGVVKDVRFTESQSRVFPEAYVPFRQGITSGMYVVVDTARDPLSLVKSVQETVWSLNPQLPLIALASMDQNLDRLLQPHRSSVAQLGLLAGMALGLALVGIYALLARHVAERTREMGIRIALGAGRRNILNLVLGRGLRLCLLGTALGLLASLWLTRFIQSQMENVSIRDPWTYVLVPLVVIAAALTASYVPARRATRVDPLVALRYE